MNRTTIALLATALAALGVEGRLSHLYAHAAELDVAARVLPSRAEAASGRGFVPLPGLEGLLARVDPDGIDLRPADEGSHGGPRGWSFGLSLQELRRGTVRVQPAPVNCHQDAGFVAYASDSHLESYTVEEHGLEHLIVLQTPPACMPPSLSSEPLELRLAARGDLCPVVGPLAKDVVFYDRDAIPVVSYSGLRVWDSQGTELEARVKASEDAISIVVDDSTAHYPITIDPLIGILRARIAPPDLVLGSNFGTAMSLDGNRLVVTSTGFFSGGPRGAAYIYEQVNSKWLRTSKLASNAILDDHYGGAVSISGDTVAVSATGASDFGVASGAVFVFALVGNQWVQQARLVANDGVASARFGASLAMHQDRLVVGAMFDDDLGQNSGSVYVFERAGTTWSQVAKLLPSNGQSNFYFGGSVDSEGDMIVVGALGVPGGGAAYVFRETGGTWQQEALIPGSPLFAGNFGYSVATSNGRILVGDPAGNRAHLFQKSGMNWNFEATLQPVSPLPHSYFGRALDIVNDQVLIGAPNYGPPPDLTLGAAFAFTRVSGSWSQVAKFTSLNTSPSGAMGFSVALNGSVYCVGEPLDSLMGWDSGSAYVFDVVEAYTTYCTAKVNSLGCSPTVAVQGVASATATQGMLISCSQVLNNTPGLLLYTTAGRSSTPFQGGLLCLNSPIRRTPARTAGGSPAPAVDCTGTFSIDMNAFARGSLGGQPIPELSIVGTVVQCQWWGRDQGLPPPFNSMLSNAAEYTVAQ